MINIAYSIKREGTLGPIVKGGGPWRRPFFWSLGDWRRRVSRNVDHSHLHLLDELPRSLVELKAHINSDQTRPMRGQALEEREVNGHDHLRGWVLQSRSIFYDDALDEELVLALQIGRRLLLSLHRHWNPGAWRSSKGFPTRNRRRGGGARNRGQMWITGDVACHSRQHDPRVGTNTVPLRVSRLNLRRKKIIFRGSWSCIDS